MRRIADTRELNHESDADILWGICDKIRAHDGEPPIPREMLHAALSETGLSGCKFMDEGLKAGFANIFCEAALKIARKCPVEKWPL